MSLALVIALIGRGAARVGLPFEFTYLHAPVLALALGRVLVEDRVPGSRGFLWALGFLAAACGTSAVTNGWEGMLPLVLFVTLAEPFALLWVLLRIPSEDLKKNATLVAAIMVMQLPIAAAQLVIHGPADFVQGTFGRATGHHTLGGAALITMVLWNRLAPGLSRPLGVLFLLLPFVSDAKQMVLLFAIALLAVHLPVWSLGWRDAAGGLAGASLFAAAMATMLPLFPAFQHILDWEELAGYGARKAETAQSVIHEVGTQWFGVGPGNGLSRASLSTLPGYGALPPAFKGDAASEFATDLFPFSDPSRSSVKSPWSSWLGVYSDLGPVGLLAYGTLAAWAVGAVGGWTGDRRMALAILLFWLMTGLVFTWLEEAAFSSVAMVTAAYLAAVPRRAPRVSSRPESDESWPGLQRTGERPHREGEGLAAVATAGKRGHATRPHASGPELGNGGPG